MILDTRKHLATNARVAEAKTTAELPHLLENGPKLKGHKEPKRLQITIRQLGGIKPPGPTQYC